MNLYALWELVEVELAQRRQSRWNGEAHWNRVLVNGLEIAARTPGVDGQVLFLFAVLHHSRDDQPTFGTLDGINHASRRYAEELRERGAIVLSDDRMSKLTEAIFDHDEIKTHDDPTIGCCWDADRLDLCRYQTRVQPWGLSTAAGRDLIGWARDNPRVPVPWSELAERAG